MCGCALCIITGTYMSQLTANNVLFHCLKTDVIVTCVFIQTQCVSRLYTICVGMTSMTLALPTYGTTLPLTSWSLVGWRRRSRVAAWCLMCIGTQLLAWWSAQRHCWGGLKMERYVGGHVWFDTEWKCHPEKLKLSWTKNSILFISQQWIVPIFSCLSWNTVSWRNM